MSIDPSEEGDIMKICNLELMQAKFSERICILLQILPHVSFSQFLANVGTIYSVYQRTCYLY